MTAPTDTEVAEKLNRHTRSPKVVGGGEEADLATSLRPGEDPQAIAREIDGIEYVDTQDVGIGRLGKWDITDE